MKLEVGKRYVRRDGKVTGPIELYNHEQYHFRDSMHAHTYHESGVWSLVEKTERDLISEYIEPEVVKDDAKTLWDEYAMAALASMNYDWFESSSRIADMVSEAATLADAMLAARKERA